jgi:hypothetical protein
MIDAEAEYGAATDETEQRGHLEGQTGNHDVDPIFQSLVRNCGGRYTSTSGLQDQGENIGRYEGDSISPWSEAG